MRGVIPLSTTRLRSPIRRAAFKRPSERALVGSEAEIKALMASAKLYGADSLSLRSDLEIAADTAETGPTMMRRSATSISGLWIWSEQQLYPVAIAPLHAKGSKEPE